MQTAVMANKTEQAVDSTQHKVVISIEPCTEKTRFVVDPQGHDLMLGMKQCRSHKAVLNCDTN